VTASSHTAREGGGGWLREGYPRSFIIGTAFAVAWSPCIGPILGAVLTMAATSGTALQGGLLLVTYSFGLGLWFLAFGAFFGWLAPRMRRVQRQMSWLLLVAGGLFIVVGTMMFLGEFGLGPVALRIRPVRNVGSDRSLIRLARRALAKRYLAQEQDHQEPEDREGHCGLERGLQGVGEAGHDRAVNGFGQGVDLGRGAGGLPAGCLQRLR